MITIPIPKGQELVAIGDVHEQEWHFDQMIDRTEVGTKRILVSCGDIYDRGEGRHVAESIIRKLQRLWKDGFLIMVRGNHEQKHINNTTLPEGPKLSDELEWCSRLPTAVSLMFHNQNRMTVLHGGITPHHTWQTVGEDPSVMYIRYVDDEGKVVKLKSDIGPDGKKIYFPERPAKEWHEVYDGRFGYILAGHQPQTSGKVKYYKHSCNLDTMCYKTGILSGQIIGNGVLKELITVER